MDSKLNQLLAVHLLTDENDSKKLKFNYIFFEIETFINLYKIDLWPLIEEDISDFDYTLRNAFQSLEEVDYYLNKVYKL